MLKLLYKSMGNLVPIRTQVETKQGELLITLNLNFNINLDSGAVKVEAAKVLPTISKEKIPDKVKYERPEFTDNSEIFEFGK